MRLYGIDDTLDYQVQNGARNIARRMNNALIYGVRVERSASENGSMGGILQFVGQPGGNVVDAGGAAISSDMLNNAIEEIIRDGGMSNVLIANTNQAKRISAFNVANLQIERICTTMLMAGFDDCWGYGMSYLVRVPAILQDAAGKDK